MRGVGSLVAGVVAIGEEGGVVCTCFERLVEGRRGRCEDGVELVEG